jgi:hypothetical protein
MTTAMAIAGNELTREREASLPKFVWRPLPQQVRDIHEKHVLSACPARPSHDNRKRSAHSFAA